jgi:hypothetical protein
LSAMARWSEAATRQQHHDSARNHVLEVGDEGKITLVKGMEQKMNVRDVPLR